MNSIAWLETFLLNYDGAVLVVAHDRYFLNRIATKIIEIDAGEVTTFQGNYSDYAAKKSKLREARMHAWLNQQREIKHRRGHPEAQILQPGEIYQARREPRENAG